MSLLYLLGPEGSGKTSLFLQLQAYLSWSSPSAASSSPSAGVFPIAPSALETSPTTGQEFSSLTVPLSLASSQPTSAGARTASPSRQGVLRAVTEQQTAMGSSTKFTDITLGGGGGGGGCSSASYRPSSSSPSRHLVQLQQPSTASHRGETARTVDIAIREIGGRMMPTWKKFLAAGLAQQQQQQQNSAKPSTTPSRASSRVSLLYVMDGTAYAALPSGLLELQSLLLDETIRFSHVVVVWNKLQCPGFAPSSVLRQLTLDMIGPFVEAVGSESRRCEQQASRPVLHVLEADSWTGEGIAEVVAWMSSLVARH